jgi:histidyl-tRNA synthetase
MGDVVLAELLKDRRLAVATDGSVDVFVAPVTEADTPDALAVTHQLRDAGLRVEYVLAHAALGKQLKLADTRGARAAVVIGPDDRARGEVVLRDLRAQGQRAVPASRILAEIGAILASGTEPRRHDND